MKRLTLAICIALSSACTADPEPIECEANAECGACGVCSNGACMQDPQCTVADAGAPDSGVPVDAGAADTGVAPDAGPPRPPPSQPSAGGGVGGEALAGALTVHLRAIGSGEALRQVSVEIETETGRLSARTDQDGVAYIEDPSLVGAVHVHAFPASYYGAASALSVRGSQVTLTPRPLAWTPDPSNRPAILRGTVRGLAQLPEATEDRARYVRIVQLSAQPSQPNGFAALGRPRSPFSTDEIVLGAGHDFDRYELWATAHDVRGVACFGGTWTEAGGAVLTHAGAVRGAADGPGSSVNLDCELTAALTPAREPEPAAGPDGIGCCTLAAAVELADGAGFAVLPRAANGDPLLPAASGVFAASRLAVRARAQTGNSTRWAEVWDYDAGDATFDAPFLEFPTGLRREGRSLFATAPAGASFVEYYLWSQRQIAWVVRDLDPTGQITLPEPSTRVGFDDPFGGRMDLQVRARAERGFDPAQHEIDLLAPLQVSAVNLGL